MSNKNTQSRKNVLITGGAGFIGQRLARALLAQGENVRILDSFSPQIHAIDQLPSELISVELIKADVRDRDAMKQALLGIDTVVHLAAETGTGQSMYEIERYFSVNVQGTAILLDLLQNELQNQQLESLIVASSRAVYGEGAYHCDTHGMVYPEQRSHKMLLAAQFDPVCPHCSGSLVMRETPEESPFKPMSMYGLTKQVQEQAILMFARTHGINGFGLRYQNVYGPGQSLKNPYTGILAVFSNLARQGQPIEIYEDGQESRDFVYIDDVVDATLRCINHKNKYVGAINVGSGEATSVLTVAEEIKSFFKSQSDITITGAFRAGDIRHNKANTNLMEKELGMVSSVSFKAGLKLFLEWASEQPIEDKAAYARSVNELASKGLMGIGVKA
ncbi:NAD-dependent epimerase/dehydratase family protein [Glaciimonas immobilis]|uniref:dTDP-L-rhamnose 4-epimerase n=1 Tax=Glaciimonas immobilis TaxID=728004 RepID=A0A840RWE4_9BURK|nr:SDR family NAD(P)-dependent oxidoreductase [Glaciimonas immobilis]KAF3997448.1 SDR family NAD(P)-dependent oxidoreductase [Glaciimonas immobilis]MBB5200881.1 dTDP-L-rhamnose 4-epimerase [Glaciimonas immobilis]